MHQDRDLVAASQNYCGMKEEIAHLLQELRAMIYPNIFKVSANLCLSPQQIQRRTGQHLEFILTYFIEEDQAAQIAHDLVQALPAIKERLDTDVRAAYEGDPAARSYDEIMLAYPSFEALSIYRIAHQLYQWEVPIIPRMMTEYAHRWTGIDIHPGAEIGDYFFIDHGNGVVIGETAEIGHHVKIYQGVTIGARSFPVDDEGDIIKGTKRHPNIGDHVVIYANATILGGDTTIGDHCVIGGSVWLTESVDPHTSVMAAHHEVTQRSLATEE